MNSSLTDLLNVRVGNVVAFVGGGGKSTLVLRLGRELADAGRPVVMATTTKMGTDQIPPWAVICQDAAAVAAALDDGKPTYLLKETDASKVIGVDPALIDEISAASNATVLVEADGSRRRPFKAPGPHEPVIPSSATLVVVVVGIDAIGQPIADASHRPGRVATLTGRSVTDAIRAEDVATVAIHASGGRQGVPRGARLVLALTKVGPDHEPEVEQIRAALADQIEVVVIDAD